MRFLTKGEKITGNLAKVQVLEELTLLLENTQEYLKILDVGCVGPQPLEFWSPILSNQKYCSKFKLFGVDIEKIEVAKDIVKQKGWHIELRTLNAYNLTRVFPRNYFNIIVSTNVLEHIKYVEGFLREIYEELKKDGYVFLTFDSAYYSRRWINIGKPVASLKRIGMKILDALGKEKYHDKPLYDYELEPLFGKMGFVVMDKRFYNIHPLKEIHNHKILKRKNTLLMKWKAFEDSLNDDIGFINQNQAYFMSLYYKLKK